MKHLKLFPALTYCILIISVFFIGYHTAQVQKSPKPQPWWTDSIVITVNDDPSLGAILWIDDIYLNDLRVDWDKYCNGCKFYIKK